MYIRRLHHVSSELAIGIANNTPILTSCSVSSLDFPIDTMPEHYITPWIQTSNRSWQHRNGAYKKKLFSRPIFPNFTRKFRHSDDFDTRIIHNYPQLSCCVCACVFVWCSAFVNSILSRSWESPMIYTRELQNNMKYSSFSTDLSTDFPRVRSLSKSYSQSGRGSL